MVEPDKKIDKCIRKNHYYGKKANLEFKAERYPRGFKIQFYQNVNHENSNGGYYDFDKLEKMPYMIKLLFINEINYIEGFINLLGITQTYGRKEYKYAVDNIKAYYVEEWHHKFDNMDFCLEEVVHSQPSYNCTDRDKKRIENGQVKYFRDYKKRLKRGKVYHNINNMWWVVLNDTDYTNVAAFNLFDATEDDFKNRKLVNRLRTEKLNPKSKRYHNQEYRIGDNLFIINERTGMFKANTDYGNFSYYWSDNDLKGLIIRMDKSYALNKLAHERVEVDYEETMKEWKESAFELKDDEYIDQEEYEDLLEYIEEKECGISLDALQTTMYDYCYEKDICEEPWETFRVSTKYIDDVEKFYKLLMEFKEILKSESSTKD
jgi:hypothetical protein